MTLQPKASSAVCLSARNAWPRTDTADGAQRKASQSSTTRFTSQVPSFPDISGICYTMFGPDVA
eukprot:2753956-Rhodomonas_salina.5